MKTPTGRSIWQAFAQASSGAAEGFENAGTARHGLRAGRGRKCPDTRNHCNTPSLRSGLSLAGPLPLSGRRAAGCAGQWKFCFACGDVGVNSSTITTTKRGSLPCTSQLSFSSCCPLRLPVVCRTLHRAGLQGPQRGQSLPMPPSLTCLPARSSVALPALPAAGSSWACRPAPRPTDLTAFGRVDLTSGTIRADRPGGPFAFRA
jgi:hypothetical protein